MEITPFAASKIAPPPIGSLGQKKATGDIAMSRLNEEDGAELGAHLQPDLAGLCLCYKEAED